MFIDVCTGVADRNINIKHIWIYSEFLMWVLSDDGSIKHTYNIKIRYLR